MSTTTDTITAIATPIGEGGIAVIRLSGPDAIAIADKAFSGRQRLRDADTYTAHFGEIRDMAGSKIDEAVATIFRAPHSYTAEDVVEISCHGGVFISKLILGLLADLGARYADPGEFTKRAFLNGRIDLAQAESVSDLIRARSQSFHRASLEQLSGRVSAEVKDLREKIINLSSLLELELDFSEEGIDLVRKDELIQKLDEIRNKIDSMRSTYREGKLVRDGVKVVLTGKPNVGKSSILNSLLKYDRAIVSDIPGTTRDTLEEVISIDGTLFRLTDTAGVRKDADQLERLGITRTEIELGNADIVLLVIDGSVGPSVEDLETVSSFGEKNVDSDTKLIVVMNKSDLTQCNSNERQRLVSLHIPIVNISALKGDGIDLLRDELSATALGHPGRSGDSGVLITSDRQARCLQGSIQLLDRCIKNAASGLGVELLAEDLHLCARGLDEIVGAVSSDDVLNQIFAKFCIGK